MSRPRIAQVLEATIGGTRRHLVALATRLPAEGFAVDAVCATRRDPHFRRDVRCMKDAGARVIQVDMVRHISPAADLRAYWTLRGIFERNRYDLVHTHSSKAGFLGRLAARAAGVPVVVHSAHTFAFEMQVASWKRSVYLALERSAARRTDLFIAVCESEKQTALRAGLFAPEEVEVIPNGLDLEDFDRLANAPDDAAAAIPAVEPDDVVIGTVGRLTPQKGHSVLLDAAPAVLREHPDALFVLIGEGESRQALSEQADRLGVANRVRFLGHREDVARLYRLMRAFVLPSLWEACPYVLLEAMAARVPVVASDLPACAEILDGGRAGLLAPVGQAEALARAICQLLSSEAEAAVLARAGRRRVEESYTLQRQIALLASTYRRLLADRP
ncbi:MAG: glycosyltransferase family 4 protein [Armatimonadota bacterium]